MLITREFLTRSCVKYLSKIIFKHLKRLLLECLKYLFKIILNKFIKVFQLK